MDRLTRLFEGDGAAVSAWCSVPDPLYLSLVAATKFDVVTLDMQHGMQTEESVIRGVQAIAPSGKPVVVRIPVGRFDFASKALDAGAHAIIAPMINTVEDAKKLASFTKYIPVGDRSYGPTQAVGMLGADRLDYVATANEKTLAFAMIETREAVENMNDILDVDGIDGVFCGPADLSISIRQNTVPDVYGEDTIKIVETMAKEARARGKLAAAFCATAKDTNTVYELGYRFIALGFDQSYLAMGVDNLISDLSFR